MAAFNYLELTRSDGIKTSISAEDGGGNCVYQLNGVNPTTPPKVSDLSAFASYLLGGVDNLTAKVVAHNDSDDNGKVIRRLPKVHPFMPELSAAKISSIEGQGDQGTADSLQILGLSPVTNQFAHFTNYWYLLEFAKRPYFLVPNELIARPKSIYYPPDNATAIDFYYAEEWKRYTRKIIRPLPDTVNATTGGQMKFRTSSGVLPAGAQYPGNISLYLQNQLLEIEWFQVPFRYLDDPKSYLTRFVNTVNQNTWNGNLPGSLLYLGAEPTAVYIPQSPNMPKFLGIAITQSQDMLCNLKLRWIYTTRVGTDVPTSGQGLADRNNIAAGHNLQPNFANRKFYYVTTENQANPTDDTKWKASFPSFPAELLFTDPLLTQGGVI